MIRAFERTADPSLLPGRPLQAHNTGEDRTAGAIAAMPRISTDASSRC